MAIDGFVNTKKKVGKRLKPTDPDFIAPDGGWGWLIVFACGLSNLSIFSMYQQFGLVFNDRFREIGLTHTQITTIINIKLALTSCIGLFNGPIYRKFSFRQVGLFGSSLVVCSLLIVIWCKSFWSYFVFYSFMYGSSVGITQSANAVALNTYFKKRRSIATGISWGTTGFGPIVWPHVITASMNYYGMEGTVLLFAGFAGHAIVCSLLLQPVHWHTKSREEVEVPLMPLYPNTRIVRSNSLPNDQNILDEIIAKKFPLEYIDSSRKSINLKTDETTTLSEFIKLGINVGQNHCRESELNINSFSSSLQPKVNISKVVDVKPKPRFFVKIIEFFDLDILKDLVYLNIIFGMISICFVDFNITVLSPVILKEFNFDKHQIATFLTLLGATDVLARFSVPFVTRKIRWNSRSYFLVGTLFTTTSRLILIHTQEFHISLFMAVMCGLGRGLCVVQVALIIPNHVSLQKLPAALGIYLASFGMFLILIGPLTGWIRDVTQSYVTTIHILNIFIYLAVLSWILEYLIKKQKLQTKVNNL